jgi:eukaryotic-like serine/threonine-protein kinase
MSSTGSSLLHFGAFEADLATGELRRNGRTVKLQPQPSKVLALLLERQGELVTREEIRQRLWGNASIDFEHGLNFAIKKLREALGDDAERPRYIETLPRRGYRFIAPLEPVGNLAAQRHVPQQPATTPKYRVSSIAEGFRPWHKATRVEGAGAGALAVPAPPDVEAPPANSAAALLASGTAAPAVRNSAIPVAGVLPSLGVGREHGQEPVLREAKHARAAARRRWVLALIAMVALVGAAGLYIYTHFRSAPKLSDQDTIVLADFTNTTGDPVFEGTLRQGLSAQLEQSPFLNLLSDTRIAQTLVLMAQPRDARLTRELARELCQRIGGAATIEGSIAGLGNQYIVGLQAVNCRTGDLLGEEQASAEGKERVLKALGEAATKLRERLGESLASVEKYDAPPENVTTPSLEALQAYSLGLRAILVQFDSAAAVPFFQRAISLDPNFAMAYARLGTSYRNLGEKARAAEDIGKAYELRERVSEREKFYISSHYETFVTGNLEAARTICELWAQTYPRDVTPPNNLGFIYQVLGEYQRALAAYQNVLKLNPGSGLNYSNLLAVYVLLNRVDEAKATVREAQAHKLDSPIFHIFLYRVDFLQHDRAAMEREAGALIGKPGYEDVILFDESDSAACAGQLMKARELTRRGVYSAQRASEKELAAGYEGEAALREALIGNRSLARQQVQAALALSDSRDAEATSAMALGLVGDSTPASRLANDLEKGFPDDTIVQSRYLPMIRAATLLGTGNASKEADRAIESLATAAPYELGTLGQTLNLALYPVYLRGQVYLAVHQGAAAAVEFQKILGYPGVVLNEPIGALAHLGLGRAYALEAGVGGLGASRTATLAVRGTSNTAESIPVRQASTGEAPVPQADSLAKAHIAYQDFFTLWKDADPDIPILKQAKAEYARLQQCP